MCWIELRNRRPTGNMRKPCINTRFGRVVWVGERRDSCAFGLNWCSFFVEPIGRHCVCRWRTCIPTGWNFCWKSLALLQTFAMSETLCRNLKPRQPQTKKSFPRTHLGSVVSDLTCSSPKNLRLLTRTNYSVALCQTLLWGGLVWFRAFFLK